MLWNYDAAINTPPVMSGTDPSILRSKHPAARPRERTRPREFVKRWLHRSCCSNPSEQCSYQQNQVGDQQKREPTDAVKLRDVAIDREHR
jgi:hypothetical protein